MISCEKETETYYSPPFDANGTDYYGWFKGTISDSARTNFDGYWLRLNSPPCMGAGYVYGDSYKMHTCKRVGGKFPFDFWDGQRVELWDSINGTLVQEFWFDGNLLVQDDTIVVNFTF